MEPSVFTHASTIEPELCRVSVIGGDTQVDIGLPAHVPVVAFIGDLVKLITSRNPDLSEHDEDAPRPTRHWTLARLGREPIPPEQTLSDAEVFDGELLIVRSVAAKESPALFDDVIDAVSRLTATSFGGWSASASRWTGLLATVAAVAAAAVVLAAAKSHGAGLAAACVAVLVGLGALGAAVVAARVHAATLVATVLSLCATVLIFVGTVLFVPGGLGSPNVLLGCAVTLPVAAIGYRATGVGGSAFAALLTAAVFAGPASAVVMVWHPAPVKVAAGVVVVAITAISFVPRLAIAFARLPVPPVPTAGGAIDPADHEPRPAIEGIGAIGATALPSAVGLQQRATVANYYQSGMVIGATAAATAGALVAADPWGETRWQGIALGVIVALVLCLRGRAFVDVTQACTLIAGGCVTFIALTVGMAFGHSRLLVPVAGMLLLLATATAVFGVLGPSTEMSPVMRRAAEVFEYLLIMAIIPLVLWITELYSAARNL